RGDGPRHAADCVLQVRDALAEIRSRAHDSRSANGVGVPVEVLGGRVHDDVEAMLERTLQVGRRECVVAHGEEPVLLRDARYRLEINQLQHRVRGWGVGATNTGGVWAGRAAGSGWVSERSTNDP